MLMKIKNGMLVSVNGAAYFVSATSMKSVHENGRGNGLCNSVSFELSPTSGGEKIVLEFSDTVHSISERDLDGLFNLLAN
jgi:hypothetical protein